MQRNHDVLHSCPSWGCYNPCFSGSSSATKEILPKFGFNSYSVTILVFLAALVQPEKAKAEAAENDFRYNPCFSGSSSATNLFHWKRRSLHLVTILVFLAALVQQTRPVTGDASLMNLSYNPCFSGSSSATHMPRDSSRDREDEVTILVFLAALVQPRSHHKNMPNGGFSYNPCFSGSSSATDHKYEMRNILIELQSLFFWQL